MGQYEKTKPKNNRNRRREDLQLNGPENFNKIIEGNFPNLKKEIPIKVQEIYRTPNKLGLKRKFPYLKIIKVLNT